MRVLLRNLETGTFFKTQTDWTTNADQAFDFQHHDLAVSVARELGLRNLELYVTTEDGRPISGTRL